MRKHEQRQQAESAEMNHAGGVIAAEEASQKVKLNRLVDSQARKDHHHTENDYRGVGQALEAVVEAGLRRGPPDARVISKLGNRAPKVTPRQEHPPAPFATEKEIAEIDRAVQGEKPRDRKVPMASALKPAAKA